MNRTEKYTLLKKRGNIMEMERESGRQILIGYDLVEELIRAVSDEARDDDDDDDDWYTF